MRRAQRNKEDEERGKAAKRSRDVQSRGRFSAFYGSEGAAIISDSSGF